MNSNTTTPAGDVDGKTDVACEGNSLNLAEELAAGRVNIIEGKGDFIGGGATGLVELLKSGDAVKSAWPGRPQSEDCRQDMRIEAQIYQRLGAHPRLVKFKHWDPVEHTLTLEYMPNGNLVEYIKQHGDDISTSQRRTWAMQVAEGVALLHSYDIFQGDVGPHNLLLDKDLELKICDFGGSSLDGSRPAVAPAERYMLPGLIERRFRSKLVLKENLIKEDLFALGSTIYFIATGRDPYSELTDEDEVQKLYKEGVFPDLGGVLFAESIAECWRQEVESAEKLIEIIRLS